ncbi:dna-binding sap [Pyrenophora tritici-repentis]|nr:dna-binding sap [Pyrenophora tritici-repentis]
MAPKSRTVTAKSLQALLTRIGARSSGTKAVLHQRLRHELHQSRLFIRHPTWQKSRPTTDQKLRIMSIDMGIKNLAFCEAEISWPVKDSLNATMHVLRWEKMDLKPPRSKAEKKRQNNPPTYLAIRLPTLNSLHKHKLHNTIPHLQHQPSSTRNTTSLVFAEEEDATTEERRRRCKGAGDRADGDEEVG